MRKQPDIVVCGTPGAWINAVCGHLHTLGWAITWKDQDLNIEDGELFLEANKQNIETQRMLESLPFRLLSTEIPKYFEPTIPTAREYLAKFDKDVPVVVSALHLGPVLNLWAGDVDIVIDVRATEQEDLQALDKYTHGQLAKNRLERIRDLHISRYNENLNLFSRKFKIANSLVKDKQFFKLDQFLKSVF